jgi:hypothetical protein
MEWLPADFGENSYGIEELIMKFSFLSQGIILERWTTNLIFTGCV